MDLIKNFKIEVKTIPMFSVNLNTNNKYERKAKIDRKQNDKLLGWESYLRKNAYKNTTIIVNESFFDDSDMKTEYNLVVVFDKNSEIPLLSTRYYFDKETIKKYLKGDNNIESELNYNNEIFNLDTYPSGTIFLADRLSGNVNNIIYRKLRKEIFALLYSEIINKNTNCTLILMVRKAKNDKQLLNYLNLGFQLIGSTLHKGKEHNIILLDFKKHRFK